MTTRSHILVFVCLGLASLASELRAQEHTSGPELSSPAPKAAPTAADPNLPKGERGLAAEGTKREPGSPPPPSETATGFDFGSYGRIGVGSDGRGHEGYSTNVVSHGSRLEEAPYLELNFYYSRLIGEDPLKKWRVVLVPAIAGGDLFHYSGSFTS